MTAAALCKEGTLGRRRSVCSRAMNYAVRRGLRPRMPPRGRKTGKERRTTRDADGDTLARSRATLLSSFSLASRSFSLLLLLAASTCVCHHLSPPPLPSSLPPSPPRRRLLDAPARITPPTLCSNRLKFSYRHVYRPSLCLEQVKCTATVVAPASTMLFSTFRRHCCAGRVAGRPRRPFLFLHPLEHSSFPPSQWKGSCQLRSFCVEDNRQNRANVDIDENTFCLSTRALNFTDVPCTLCVRYDEESRLFCERTAINSTTSFFFRDTGKKRRPLYVCLTRTRRMNNRIVKYFSVTPHDSGREPSPLIAKVD